VVKVHGTSTKVGSGQIHIAHKWSWRRRIRLIKIKKLKIKKKIKERKKKENLCLRGCVVMW
jgi:hypothetical protein